MFRRFFNGDVRDDLVARSNQAGQLWVGASTGSMFRIQTAFSTPILVGASLEMRIVPICNTENAEGRPN
jgi:hypothetical protein